MSFKVFVGIMIPFLGTLLGSSAVFVMKNKLNTDVERVLSAVAGGIMTAASVWSLIIPSLELTSADGSVQSVMQTAAGFLSGVLIMIWADKKISGFSVASEENIFSIKMSDNKNIFTQFVAITLHNIPEGMAVGMVYSALLSLENTALYSAALVLSVGIAAQNIPEGAIISMPLHAQGMSKIKAFVLSSLSGVVEPFGAVIAVYASKSISELLPFFLAFAAGAMIYVVTEQLIPCMYSQCGKNKSLMTVMYVVGFLLMMSLDVIFG